MTDTKKKVGIITFHNYDNYGAILQSYALQKRIRQTGKDVDIIDYNCEYISKPFSLQTLKKKGLFNYIYGAIGHICYLPRRYRCQKFRKLMNYSRPMTAENRDEIGGEYDAYVAGSDQIWDYKLTDFDQTYFLDFVQEGHKKFSYAASIGENMPPEEYQETYRKLLDDFDAITVRESYGADVVEQLIGRRPGTVCDPTLLFSGAEWEKLSVKPRVRKPYILVYQLGINTVFVDFVRRLQKKTGLRVIYVPFPLVGIMRCRMKLTIGPREWLGLFQKAEYVVSDSFHGAVFSILFNRKFFIMTNGHHMNKRANQLLELCGLQNRTIEDVSDEQLTEEIDFSYANRKIDEYRRESLKQLEALMNQI
ncbi:MAG: polysaccharide pyruvyl transferase family protein [Eubacterium sp.]|nr:polysaccharide pyruvyl transferase family protein [Eubacterium sp.]